MICKGHNGQIEADDTGITISRKGVMGFLTQGPKGDKRIPYESIAAAQIKPASLLVNGYIRFTIIGEVESRTGTLRATADENTVMFQGREQGEAFAKLREAVQEKIDQRCSRPVSAADEIAKLAGLRAGGLITPEEYEAKKRQILGL